MKLAKSILSLIVLFGVLVPFIAAAAPTNTQQALPAAAPPNTQQILPEPTPEPTPPAYYSSCQLYPSDAYCTGQDPEAMGCTYDAYTLSKAEVPGKIRIVVRYSPSCRSAWAKGVNLSYQPDTILTAQIMRNDGTSSAQSVVYPTIRVLSPMVFVNSGQTVRAIGFLSDIYGTLITQVQTGFVQP